MTPVILVVGPTASGKSDMALDLARQRDDIEIINADSRQTYRRLRVATCAPDETALAHAPHHLYEIRDPGEELTVVDWLEQARRSLDEIAARKHVAVVVGGTGLYVRALLDGIDDLGPAPDRAVRLERTRSALTASGQASLRHQLIALDPDAAELVEMHNPRRVIRAIEILESTGRPLREVWTRRSSEVTTPRGWRVLGIRYEPAELNGRIERRCRAMFDSGALLAETRAELDSGTAPEQLSRCGIGYREALAVLDGSLSSAEALESTLIRTRRYAKAQRTFFGSDHRVRWLPSRHAADGAATDLLNRG